VAAREALLARSLAVLRQGWAQRYEARMAVPTPPAHFEALKPLGSWLASYLAGRDEEPEDVASALLDAFFARTDLKRPKPEWLAEDPARYLGASAEQSRLEYQALCAELGRLRDAANNARLNGDEETANDLARRKQKLEWEHAASRGTPVEPRYSRRDPSARGTAGENALADAIAGAIRRGA
jgi:hypothetical protein